MTCLNQIIRIEGRLVLRKHHSLKNNFSASGNYGFLKTQKMLTKTILTQLQFVLVVPMLLNYALNKHVY